MRLIEILSGKISEEISDAKSYAKMALENRESYPDLAQTLYDLNNAYADRYGIYIQSSGDLRPLADFVRVIRPDTRYWFGGSVDYHA